jgi:hypothetical protein
MRYRPDRRGVGLGCPGSAGGSSGRATAHHPTFVPSSTLSFASYGQAASGECCHANFHRVAVKSGAPESPRDALLRELAHPANIKNTTAAKINVRAFTGVLMAIPEGKAQA